jgi:ABC-type uncharacterized transport system ATPase subunit
MDVELRGITKRFGPVVANEGVNLTARAGEVLGLLGENGAGKSTLMNVLCGLYRPDEGQILIDGKEVSFDGPGDAITAGIGMVHQHFMLVPVFTVAENVVLGVEPTGRLNHLDLATARTKVRDIGDRYGLAVDPDALIETLPVGVQQRVEIIKVLFRSANVLILDEPTAVLTPAGSGGLLRHRPFASGCGQVDHLHHPQTERDHRGRGPDQRAARGPHRGRRRPQTMTRAELAEIMVGRPVRFDVDKTEFVPGAPRLEVRDLTVLRDDEEIAVDDVSLTVRAGEIVGIAGVQGNGQSALIEAITGLRDPASGQILFDGTDITHLSPRRRHRMGMAHIPEDRQRMGLVTEFTVAENMVLDSYYSDRFSRGPQVNWDAVKTWSADAAVDFDVRTPSIFAQAGHLSGGNQQKLIVARELARDTKLVIAAQPTRGLDVGSIEYIHARLMAARAEGDGVLIMSSELDEILSLSDRIVVMFKGRIVAEFDASTAPPEKAAVGLAMAGAAA